MADIVLCELHAKVENDKTRHGSNNDYISALNTYLIPFYGNYNVDSVTQPVVNEFNALRAKKVGRELSQSAQANHNAAMNLVLDKGLSCPRVFEGGFYRQLSPAETVNAGIDYYQALLEAALKKFVNHA